MIAQLGQITFFMYTTIEQKEELDSMRRKEEENDHKTLFTWIRCRGVNRNMASK
ncbi:hypothetical protein JCM9152_3913 [Halalkalibacter hemicellulosilyticusJCM 9152]|uniref:Uncharacterized protein n=1 Tax=Halalkalibacter hemicellulosilyticusJCM 9152 TaxID=1236971 RepID=W4QM06_9BACI|nr:hypothetical protein JCM9152_3913 [Halalkalibacter hemicellulosilyticusJCM 9152]